MLQTIIDFTIKIGIGVKEIYDKNEYWMESKEDESPLTEADIYANNLIVKKLAQYGYPIISEENKITPFEERKEWDTFWLIDPIDGTQEFVKRSGEFTLNIALIKNNVPILGVVYAPVLDVLYFADEKGAFRLSNASSPSHRDNQKLPYSKTKEYTVVCSRSYMNNETKEFIQNLEKKHAKLQLKSIGSSLKICLVAEGNADLYPRLGTTMEWDTAAAHAILRFSGGKLHDYNSDEELSYNKLSLKNPSFICLAP